MNDIEPDLRLMLQERAALSTEVTSVDVRGVRQWSLRWGVVAPVAGALVAAIAVVAIALIASPGSNTATDVGPASPTAQDVEGLTTAELVDLLGLEPVQAPATVTGCHRFVGPEDVGYCLDGLQVDAWTREHIAAQLMGYQDNEALHTYVDVAVAWRAAKGEDNNGPEIAELGRELLDAKAQMTKVSP